jgi:hypothetical protein
MISMYSQYPKASPFLRGHRKHTNPTGTRTGSWQTRQETGICETHKGC